MDDRMAEAKRKSAKSKKKAEKEEYLKGFDLETAPHLSQMSEAWQRLYVRVAKGMGKGEV
jgi:hypothetical protein